MKMCKRQASQIIQTSRIKPNRTMTNRIQPNEIQLNGMQSKGFSLIEVLVVIAIIAIMAGAVGLGVNFAFSRDCEKAAKSIDSQMNIVQSMTTNQSGEYALCVEAAGTGKQIVVYDGVTVIDTESLEDRVEYTFLLDGVEHTSAYVEIRFQKSNGKVKSITFSDETIDGENLPAVLTIHCSNSSGKTSDVVLVTLTGKHYVE